MKIEIKQISLLLGCLLTTAVMAAKPVPADFELKLSKPESQAWVAKGNNQLVTATVTCKNQAGVSREWEFNGDPTYTFQWTGTGGDFGPVPVTGTKEKSGSNGTTIYGFAQHVYQKQQDVLSTSITDKRTVKVTVTAEIPYIDFGANGVYDDSDEKKTEPVTLEASLEAGDAWNVVELNISPNCGPIGTRITMKILPEGIATIALDQNPEHVSLLAIGKFSPQPATLGESAEYSYSYPVGKITFNDGGKSISIKIGENGACPTISNADMQRGIAATGGVCSLSMVRVYANNGKSISTPFTFTPVVTEGNLAIGKLDVNGNFFPISDFYLGEKLYVQYYLKKEGQLTGPSSVNVTMKCDNVTAPLDGYAPISRPIVLNQQVDDNQEFYIYRSLIPVVPWDRTLSDAEYQANFIFFNDQSKLEVTRE